MGLIHSQHAISLFSRIPHPQAKPALTWIKRPVGDKGFNLFLFSARTQSLDLLRTACENPAVNLQDEYGWTALHYAKVTKNEALINMMLDSAASFDQDLASKKQRKIGK